MDVAGEARAVAYFDHAASTPLRASALEAMLPFLSGNPANPTGSHRLARQARRAVDDARDAVAALVGAEPGEVVFTSGATESDSLAVGGGHRIGRRVLCSAVEHPAVLEAVLAVGGSALDVDEAGGVDLGSLTEELRRTDAEPVGFVSVMAVNNEVGTVQHVDEVADALRRWRPDAVLHVDAAQAPTWVDLPPMLSSAQLVSLSAHKFGGPKGAGALVVRKGTALRPLQVGGGQERGRRGGTPNVAAIVGMGVAAVEVVAEREALVARVGRLRNRLLDGLAARCPEMVEVGPEGRGWKVAGNAHVCFPAVASDSLLFLLDEAGVAASAASSCSSGAAAPSHVLAAMGVPASLAGGALRLTLGRDTTDAEVDLALATIPDAVARVGGSVVPEVIAR